MPCNISQEKAVKLICTFTPSQLLRHQFTISSIYIWNKRISFHLLFFLSLLSAFAWIWLRKGFSINSKSDAAKREMLMDFSEVHKEQFQKNIFPEQNIFFVYCQCTTHLACFLIHPFAFILYDMLILRLKGALL